MAPEDRTALSRQLFALLTIELEDVIAIAANGRRLTADHRRLAARLVRYGEDVALLAKAAGLALGWQRHRAWAPR